jgi:hypothetical protein
MASCGNARRKKEIKKEPPNWQWQLLWWLALGMPAIWIGVKQVQCFVSAQVILHAHSKSVECFAASQSR